MLKKILIAAGIVIVVGILSIAYFILFPPGPDLASYEFLKEPRITKLPDQKMLEIRVIGDPGTAGKEAFGALFKTFFKIKNTTKGVNMAAPRARWPKPFDAPRNEWVGVYGIPVPVTVMSLPEQESTTSSKVALTAWKYGDVAEILHIGSYGEEMPTIEKLFAFIKQQGYEIVGDHEEEYLKGPGMFFSGDPKTYYTIIRYQVAKSGATGMPIRKHNSH